MKSFNATFCVNTLSMEIILKLNTKADMRYIVLIIMAFRIGT